ncbi:MAG: M48 family metallopeptidase, partial [Fimbriimonadaceae bacterium]|nr:M48 family metallopeptidase [Alphaproteobacteria bacterium]
MLNALKFLNSGGADRRNIELDLDGRIVPVVLRHNARARRFILRVDPKARAVKLTIPPGGTIAEANRFLDKQKNWVRVRLNRLPAIIPFADGAKIPFRGAPHMIAHRPGPRRVVWI